MIICSTDRVRNQLLIVFLQISISYYRQPYLLGALACLIIRVLAKGRRFNFCKPLYIDSRNITLFSLLTFPKAE